MINEILVRLRHPEGTHHLPGGAKYFWGLAVISDLWKEMGWSAIIYLAAISGIDQSMYEAATVDGANKIQKIWNITLPAIRGTIAIMFIPAVSGIMNSNFDQIFILKKCAECAAQRGNRHLRLSKWVCVWAAIPTPLLLVSSNR